MILNNIFTDGRPQSTLHMIFLQPAREKGRAAIEAYHQGDLEPLAELLRNSIRQTNREAACVATPDKEHGKNTLYLIGRM